MTDTVKVRELIDHLWFRSDPCGQLAGYAKELADTVDAIRGENEEWEKRFALYTAAMERGRKMWQAAHPEADYWPDAGDNWAWLAGEVTRLRSGLAKYGKHKSNCGYHTTQERTCSCGLAQARGEK